MISEREIATDRQDWKFGRRIRIRQRPPGFALVAFARARPGKCQHQRHTNHTTLYPGVCAFFTAAVAVTLLPVLAVNVSVT